MGLSTAISGSSVLRQARSEMSAESHTGPGMASRITWTGAPALSPGVRISAVISRMEWSQSMLAAGQESNGSRIEASGSMGERNWLPA